MIPASGRVSKAGATDAETIAQLLHDFNVEYGTPTPAVPILAARLRRLLPRDDLFALLVREAPGQPVLGCAVVTLRPTVWDEGPVATLDELYVVPARRGQGWGAELLAEVEEQTRLRGGRTVEINVDGDGGGAPRFYERHGYRNTEVGDDVPLLYYFREL